MKREIMVMLLLTMSSRHILRPVIHLTYSLKRRAPTVAALYLQENVVERIHAFLGP
jgi:hypothetical protein